MAGEEPRGYSIFKETIADLTWPEVEAAVRKGAAMLVPVAVIEQHGPHLPLGTDTYAAYLLGVLIKKDLESQGFPAVMAPPYYFGLNETTWMFPGSLNVKRASLVALLTDLLLNYQQAGFSQQFILNHHGDPQHNDAVMEAIRNARDQGVEAVYIMGGFVQHFITEAYQMAFKKPLPLPPEALIMAGESAKTRKARLRLTRSQLHVHAEERETSLMMRYYPELIKDKEAIKGLRPVLPTPEEFGSAALAGRWRELSPMGYIGDPSVARQEVGELYALEAKEIAAAVAKYLEQKRQKWI